jgi:hypothetical protein
MEKDQCVMHADVKSSARLRAELSVRRSLDFGSRSTVDVGQQIRLCVNSLS